MDFFFCMDPNGQGQTLLECDPRNLCIWMTLAQYSSNLDFVTGFISQSGLLAAQRSSRFFTSTFYQALVLTASGHYLIELPMTGHPTGFPQDDD